MNVLRQTQHALGIRPDEGRVVWFTFALFFWGGTARVLMGNAAYSRFLSQYDSQAIPYIYILTGVVMVFVMTIYLHLTSRLALAPLVMLNLGLSTVLTLLATALLALWPSPVLAFLLPVWFEAFCMLLPLALWAMASRLFTVRQGKRLFGIVASGIPLGFIAGGLLTRPISTAWGGVGLLAASTAGLAVTLLLAAVASRRFRARFVGTAAPSRMAAKRNPLPALDLVRNRYILLIFGLLISWTLAFFFVDNMFLERMGAAFDTEAALASFMGAYSMTRGMLMLLVGVLFAGPILGRYGVRNGLLVLPAVIVMSTLFLVVPGSLLGVLPFLLWPAVATKLLFYAFDTVSRPSLSILYQPLAIDDRVRVQAMSEGILQTVMVAAAGLLLLGLTTVGKFTVVPLGYALLAVLAIWLGVALLAGREYPKMLMSALMRRRLDDTTVSLDDDSSRAVLEQALRNPHPDVVIYVLRQLEEASAPVGSSVLARLLEHPAPLVRQTVLERIERSRDPGLLPPVVARFGVETDLIVRAALLLAMFGVSSEQATGVALAALTDTAPDVRRAAAVGLLLHAGREEAAVAADELRAWACAARAEERVVAAEVVGAVGVGAYDATLIDLLGDADPAVRRSALAAAGCDRAGRLWPQVIRALDDATTASAAIAVLATGGETALDALRSAWHAPAATMATQMGVVQACGRMRTAAAAELLASRIAVEAVDLRSALLHALQRCGYRAAAAQQAQVRELIWREAGEAAWVLAVRMDVGDGTDPYRQLLSAALDLELHGQRMRVLTLLSFIADAAAIRRAQEILNVPSATPDQRAYAQEILDLATPQEIKAPVLALVDDLSPAQQLQRLQAFFPQRAAGDAERVRELAETADGRLGAWTLACTLGVLAAANPSIGETTMLSILERVIILKSAGIFAAVPDKLLAAVAAAADEVLLRRGEQLFAKGDLGQELYVIVSGSMRIHDGDHTLNRLRAHEVFGEMALLDARPRSASATADEETLLLCLRQEEFFELLEDHGAIARGVIQVLSQRLRARSEELAHLHAA